MLTVATTGIKNLLLNITFLIILTFVVSPFVNANENIPADLKQWEAWVLKDSPSVQCPILYNSNKNFCAYPDSLSLDMNSKSGKFNQIWNIYADSLISLPGDNINWPKNVKVNGRSQAVISRNNIPSMRLQKGRYSISGDFNWHEQPKSLSIPQETGIIKLKINNKNIAFPDIRKGKLWLKTTSSQSDQNNYLDIQVFRKINDTIPLRITTQIKLNIAGQQREITLDGALLEKFLVSSINSQLPAQIDKKGRLKIQIRPGTWVVNIDSFNSEKLNSISLPTYSKPWPKSEIWVLNHQAQLRLIKVIGKNSIDPNQTQLPKNWKSLPAYSLQAGEKLNFDILKRGNPDPEPNQLFLKKQIWLDFDGNGFTLNDKLTGKLSRDWRLNASETNLGQVTLNGKPQLITENSNKQQGIEIRHGNLNLSADSRIEGKQRTLSASGWDVDFNKVNATLYLPAGWKLMSLSGANTNRTWLKQWTLLDLFMVLITAIAIYKLFGLKWGAMALITLTLAWHTRGSPQYIWINLILAIAILRVIPEGRFYKILNNYRLISSITLIVIILPFMVDQIRTTLYPQLEFNSAISTSAHYRANRRAASSPAVEKGIMQEPEMAMSLSDTKARVKRKVEKRSFSSGSYELKKVPRIDPDAMIQTGPGLPSWKLHRYPLSWDGPVRKGQEISMLTLSPFLHGVFKVIQIIFILLLAWKLIDVSSIKLPKLSGLTKESGAKLIMTLGLFGLLFTSSPITVEAAFPSQTLLKELKQELIKPAKCLPQCASIESMAINLSKNQLDISLRIHSEEDVLLPLPIPIRQWTPSEVAVDGKEVSGLVRYDNASLWIHNTKGSHTVTISGRVTHLNQLQFDFPLKPYDIKLKMKGWSSEGMDKEPHKITVLTFLREAGENKRSKKNKIEQSEIPVYAQVTRSLQLGLEWYVTTQVRSVSGTAYPVILNIPLLDGESVITDNILVKDKHAVISLNNNRASYSWTSKLESSDEIKLQASNKGRFIEKWLLDASPVWHVNLDGIPVIYHQRRGNNWRPEWQPWPGENVSISVTKPTSVIGKTLTIDSSTLTLTPGAQITSAKLAFNLRSSLGGQHVIHLPENADLQKIKINNKNMPIRNTDKGLSLPVTPGNQKIEIEWREARGISSIFHSSKVDLGNESVNNAINIKPGNNRWVLFTAGPTIGPAILFWGMLIVIVLISYGLGLIKGTPLNSIQWILLGFGLSASGPWGLVIVAACIFTLRARGNFDIDNMSYKKFNFIQVGLFLLVFITVSTLLGVIEQGLLGSPDMQIKGNGSNSYQLNWFSDRVSALIPNATFISVPIYIFRLLMLVWSIWLAFAVVKWAQWSWANYSKDGYWRSKPEKTNEKEKESSDEVKKLE